VAQDSLEELKKHAEYQRKFVNQAVKLLKVGGYMTYSTCTINGDENEGMVSHILKEYPCMKLLPITLPSAWGQKNLGLPGLDGFGLTSEERNSVCRFDPSSKGDTMGFFVALFRKIS
jgi:16S rRNA C967 or C1407 C5-methylase (RsmB/RsmF family)